MPHKSNSHHHPNPYSRMLRRSPSDIPFVCMSPNGTPVQQQYLNSQYNSPQSQSHSPLTYSSPFPSETSPQSRERSPYISRDAVTDAFHIQQTSAYRAGNSMARAVQPHRQGPPSSPQRRGASSYEPKAIPKEKIPTAAKHYNYYLKVCMMEKKQEQLQTQVYAGGEQNVAAPPTSRSAPSLSQSRPFAGSVTGSVLGTDLSSVINFTGDESNIGQGSMEGKSVYDGRTVKERKRRNLTPREKAKAAFIRFLGACPTCKDRSVGCDIEHHDIASLKRFNKTRSPHIPRSASVGQAPANTSFRQSDALRGLGQNEQLMITVPQNTGIESEWSSTFIDPLSGISSSIFPSSTGFGTQPPTSHPALHNEGGLFFLGIARLGAKFICSGPNNCRKEFDDPDMLAAHFSQDHFPFTKAFPFHQYRCSTIGCSRQEQIPFEYCMECTNFNTCETRICGRFKVGQQNSEDLSPQMWATPVADDFSMSQLVNFPSPTQDFITWSPHSVVDQTDDFAQWQDFLHPF